MAPSPGDGVEDCDNCGRPMDACDCRCPYCGQLEECECAIGTEAATGG